MDNFSFGNPANNIRNGVIEDISFANNNTFVTVSRANCTNCRRGEETIRLVVGNNTLILNENGNPIPVRNLRVGMTVNASFSSAMTRSIPPQASAYIIQIIRRPLPDSTTVGRIVDINRQNRSFTTAVSDSNLSSIIRFNVPQNALIFDRAGRPINFSRLVPGMRVWVRHASFMTASIPPQTTAFEIRVR